ncbi:MAG: glycosyltransferase family 4 protein [Gemmatimonadota bacterium]|nr:glycosyltransferase family 4 protein [Gemmatimonadota bacterium]
MKRIVLAPDLPQEQWPSMDRYALRLMEHLKEYAHEFEVVSAGPVAKLTSPSARAVSVESAMGLPGSVAEARRYIDRYWTYGRKVKRLSGDLLHVLDHSYGHLVGSVKGAPTLVTVHDLHPVHTTSQPASSVRERVRNQMLHRVLDSIRRADGWIVSTEWLKNQLEEWLERSGNIWVVPYGVDNDLFDDDLNERKTVRNSWGVSKEAVAVLHVGSVVPRKRFEMAIETVALLRGRKIDAHLIQVGATLTPAQKEILRERRLDGFAKMLGPVNEMHLKQAYRGADVLMFPSSYEGFGLPVIEAMAAGLPVVNSGAGALAEVSGQGAVVVEEFEASAYADRIQQIVSDESFRANLVQRGKKRAGDFKWEETARLTAEVYRNLA